MKQLQPCMTEREGGLMSCFLPLALLQRNTVKQKTCALSSFLLLIFIKTVQGYFSSLASNTTFTVFRECNSYKLIWQKISSLVIPHCILRWVKFSNKFLQKYKRWEKSGLKGVVSIAQTHSVYLPVLETQAVREGDNHFWYNRHLRNCVAYYRAFHKYV